ncbi:hypothetical protein SIL82_10320 [Sphingomonas echinoides]|uniref:Uncharacterized protein n=1 Tax=Sphingomonas echinoides TaxID=59803 RepID=A0ABU4PKD9_9SPHN|nr:hypothetical protein [Sphingomonas echinoides]MDX5984658.1 hypothetical protein [Sphingomonas echinoides]
MPFARFERCGVDHVDQIADLRGNFLAIRIPGTEAVREALDAGPIRFGDLRVQRHHVDRSGFVQRFARRVAFGGLGRQCLANVCEVGRSGGNRGDEVCDRALGRLQAARQRGAFTRRCCGTLAALGVILAHHQAHRLFRQQLLFEPVDDAVLQLARDDPPRVGAGANLAVPRAAEPPANHHDHGRVA